jgi:hypothetical protein
MDRFDGSTFDSLLDGERLSKQLGTVRTLMADQIWRTLPEIERITRYPQASISARLRDLRKDKFGSYRVERRRREGPSVIWEYRVLPPFFDEEGQSAFEWRHSG